jgi:hypothetical protein
MRAVRAVESALLVLGVAAGAAGIRGALHGDRVAYAPAEAVTLRSSSGIGRVGALSDDSLAALLEVAVQRNPFRESRTPSSVELLDGEAASTRSEMTARPTLRLVGIVGGPPWSALLDGMPGREGAVLVAASDTAGDLVIASVDSAQVRVVGRDTVWILTLERGQS